MTIFKKEPIIIIIMMMIGCYWLSFIFLELSFLFWQIWSMGKGFLELWVVLGLKAREFLCSPYYSCSCMSKTKRFQWSNWHLRWLWNMKGIGIPYFIVLHFIVLHRHWGIFLTSWRFVATLQWTSLLAPFLQKDLLTLCLCVTFW